MKQKFKTKGKKSTRTKTSFKNKDLMENMGAPEIESHENDIKDEFQPPVEEAPDISSLKLIRRAMKVKYLQVVDKEIRKAQRNLNKINKTGIQEKIEEA